MAVCETVLRPKFRYFGTISTFLSMGQFPRRRTNGKHCLREDAQSRRLGPRRCPLEDRPHHHSGTSARMGLPRHQSSQANGCKLPKVSPAPPGQYATVLPIVNPPRHETLLCNESAIGNTFEQPRPEQPRSAKSKFLPAIGTTEGWKRTLAYWRQLSNEVSGLAPDLLCEVERRSRRLRPRYCGTTESDSAHAAPWSAKSLVVGSRFSSTRHPRPAHRPVGSESLQIEVRE